jgi:hypothetical protein
MVVRKFILVAAMAMGLVMLWAAILPLIAQPSTPLAATSPSLSKALFLCRGPHGVDRACAHVLANALVLESSDRTVTHVNNRLCHVDRQMSASLKHRD